MCALDFVKMDDLTAPFCSQNSCRPAQDNTLSSFLGKKLVESYLSNCYLRILFPKSPKFKVCHFITCNFKSYFPCTPKHISLFFCYVSFPPSFIILVGSASDFIHLNVRSDQVFIRGSTLLSATVFSKNKPERLLIKGQAAVCI